MPLLLAAMPLVSFFCLTLLFFGIAVYPWLESPKRTPRKLAISCGAVVGALMLLVAQMDGPPRYFSGDWQLTQFQKDEPVSLSTLPAEIRLIYLWKPDHKLSQEQFYHVMKMYARLRKHQPYFTMLAICMDPNASLFEIEQLARKLRVPKELIYLPKEPLPSGLRLGALPATYIMKANGEILFAKTGVVNINSFENIQAINALLPSFNRRKKPDLSETLPKTTETWPDPNKSFVPPPTSSEPIPTNPQPATEPGTEPGTETDSEPEFPVVPTDQVDS